MPEINNIFIDDPKKLNEPIKTLEVRENEKPCKSTTPN